MKKLKRSEKLKKAVIDTNVIVSGILSPNGFPSRIIDSWLQHGFIGLLSEPLITEIVDVLSRPKIIRIAGVKSIHFENIIRALIENSMIIKPDEKIDVCPDPDDNMLFELASKGQSDFIVTGDKIILKMKQYQNIRIVSPTWFAVNILN